jgi:hypothetical protein
MAAPAEAVSCIATLLANADDDITQNPTKYVNMFLQDSQFAQRVQHYIHPQGTLVHHKHVFEWWFCLFMDRLDIKLAAQLSLDPHERIIATIQNQNAKRAEEYAVINYFASHVVPRNGFSAAQIRDALDDPTRWMRRDEQDKILLQQDPSGASLDAFNIARLLDGESKRSSGVLARMTDRFTCGCGQQSQDTCHHPCAMELRVVVPGTSLTSTRLPNRLSQGPTFSTGRYRAHARFAIPRRSTFLADIVLSAIVAIT